jgi:hypothetical protein
MGDPATTITGRSFDGDGGYKVDTVSQLADDDGVFVAALVRINGAEINATDKFSVIAGHTDAWSSAPTKGWGLGIGLVATGLAENQSYLVISACVNGTAANAIVKDVAGVVGRWLLVHMWFNSDAQELQVGYNGKWHDEVDVGADLVVETTKPMYIGSVPASEGITARLYNCRDGLCCISQVGILTTEGPSVNGDAVGIISAEMAKASIFAAAATMRYQTLTLFDPDLDSSNNAFAGEDWDHYWRFSTPDTNPDEVVLDIGTGGDDADLLALEGTTNKVEGLATFASGKLEDFADGNGQLPWIPATP